MMLTANRASRRGAPCERRSSAVSPAFHASSQQARSLRPSLRPLAEPPSTAGQSDGLSRHTMTPRGLAEHRIAQRRDRGLLDHDPCRDKIMVGRGIRWHRRRNRAQLGGLTAFLPPAFGPLSCLLGARHMTAVPLVIVPPQRVLDRDEQPAHRGERRRLAAGRAAEQGLPQHQRLRPGRRDLRRHAGAAHAGDGGEEGLGHIVGRRARRPRRSGDPVAPRPGQSREWNSGRRCVPRRGGWRRWRAS